MKRHGHLFDSIAEPDNIRLALHKASRGKKWRRGIIHTMKRADDAIIEISEMLKNQTYRTSPYHEKTVYEPKKRTIYSLPFFPDRITHHAIMNIMEPLWDKLLDSNSYSCRKGKGTHSGSLLCMKYTRRYKYVLKCDISKFYPSIDHAVCKAIIRKKLKDPRLLKLLDEIIDSANTIPNAVQGKNAPIGNLLSQWFGNLYLNELDLWLRQECGVKAFVRYCDDFVIFSDSKEFLNDIKNRLPDFLESHLKLHLSKANLFPVTRGIDFLGYKHFPRFVLVRKRTARKIKAFAKTAQAAPPKDLKHVQGVVSSYNGVLKHANSYNLRKACGFDEVYAQYRKIAS